MPLNVSMEYLTVCNDQCCISLIISDKSQQLSVYVLQLLVIQCVRMRRQNTYQEPGSDLLDTVNNTITVLQ